MKLKALLAGIGLALTSSVVHADTEKPNIIYIIGDGMGFEYISAYRYAMSDLDTKTIAQTEFDTLLKGAATTYPDDDTWVTDSAAGATALSTGVKSYNGAVGVDTDKHPLQTIMEMARDNDWATGSVSTSQVNHATPASFFTHHPSRYEYNQIAAKIGEQIVKGTRSFDVMLGGGLRYFDRDDANWMTRLPEHGMPILTDMEQLDSVESVPVMGLFADKGLPHAIDDNVDALATMTDTAIRLLDKTDKPFALMIEGSEIDWCGHANDIACAVHEMDSLNRALKVVANYREKNPNTLIVMTADHSTGGLTLGRDGDYAWYSDRVMAIKHSIAYMTNDMLSMDPDEWASYVSDNVQFELTQEYLDELAVAAEHDGKERKSALHDALVYITGDITGTGWTTSGHTAVDVPVFAAGPHSENFGGYMNNIDISKNLIEIVQE